jgi:GntR family transcriptional regulator, arabinose operon transcriptional repressor
LRLWLSYTGRDGGDYSVAQEAKYKIVKKEIMDWILGGRVIPGQKISSEHDLVKFFGVSRQTIRQAIGELVHEGWLYREQGAGTFCAQPNQNTPRENKRNIGVITTYISDYIFPSIVRGVESYLTSQGYSLTFASTNNDPEREKQCLQMMMNKQIDGLIVEPTKSSSHNPNIHYYLALEQNKIPYLMINQFYQVLNPSHIVLDDEKGGFLATEHLIHLGHEKIVGLFKSDDMQGINRMKGFIRAFRENQLSFFSEMIITYTTEDRDSKPEELLKRLFESEMTRPTAIVCYNDEMALKILHVIREIGLKVPEEFSIVGFDNSHLAEASEVQLTTIDHPKAEMGVEAAKWLVAAIEGNNKPPLNKSIVYEPKLIIRNSTSHVNQMTKV